MVDRRRAARYVMHAADPGAVRMFEDVVIEHVADDRAVIVAWAAGAREDRVMLHVNVPGGQVVACDAVILANTPIGDARAIRFRQELQLTPGGIAALRGACEPA